MEELLSLLNHINQMSPELENRLRNILTQKTFKKKETILSAGQISKNIYYIQTGLIRGYEWKKEQEVTTWLMKEKDIFFSPKSFLRQIPSTENIMALEETVAYGISYTELEYLYKAYPEFNVHGRIITGEYYIRHKDLHDFTTRNTALEKYKILYETDPGLISRVHVKYLASYLDITPETLSSIRSQFQDPGNKQ